MAPATISRRGVLGHILGAAAASSAVSAVALTAPKTPTRQDLIAYYALLWGELNALQREAGITSDLVVCDLSGECRRLEEARSRRPASERALRVLEALNI